MEIQADPGRVLGFDSGSLFHLRPPGRAFASADPRVGWLYALEFPSQVVSNGVAGSHCGGNMAVWHPHLRLKLEPDAVTASTASRTSFYHTPTFDPRLREVSRQLLVQMNVVLSRGASSSERSKAEAAVQQLGLELYEEIFSVSGEDGRLEEVLRDTLQADSNGAPPAITVEGEWYALP